MTTPTGRSWGFWTQAKLQMLSEYLDSFSVASKSQTERVYLDAFAGEAMGLDRLTGEEFHGSARIALEASEQSGFTRFRYFEIPRRAADLESRLREDYPGHDIKVYPGDCNTTIPQALGALHDLRWAPTFAFVDPDGMELAWETIVALAEHKRGYRGERSTKPEYKVELWMLFPTSGIVRTLALDPDKVTEADEARADRLIGTDQWRTIYELRRGNELTPAEARDEYVNLMRWRLERVLGYRFTHPFEVKNSKEGTLYHMIFATDHDAGTRIMERIYDNALKRWPEMRREARDRASGQQALNLGFEPVDTINRYQYEPPWEPRS